MLWNIYLGTTAISWIIGITVSIACDNKLKREGYKTIKKEKTLSEKIVSLASTILAGIMPGYNILSAIVGLWMYDTFYEYSKSKLLKEQPTEPSETDTDSQDNTETKYHEMTPDETSVSLEYEKEMLRPKQDILENGSASKSSPKPKRLILDINQGQNNDR